MDHTDSECDGLLCLEDDPVALPPREHDGPLQMAELHPSGTSTEATGTSEHYRLLSPSLA